MFRPLIGNQFKTGGKVSDVAAGNTAVVFSEALRRPGSAIVLLSCSLTTFPEDFEPHSMEILANGVTIFDAILDYNMFMTDIPLPWLRVDSPGAITMTATNGHATNPTSFAGMVRGYYVAA